MTNLMISDLIIEITNIIMQQLHLNYITCREVINVLDRMGNTPLHYATQMWSQSVVRMLLERGANIGMKVAHNKCWP